MRRVSELMRISARTSALEALLQWLYRGVVSFNTDSPEETISAAMEFVRFADLYEINGLEAVMAEYIKQILLSAEFHLTVLMAQTSFQDRVLALSMSLAAATDQAIMLQLITKYFRVVGK